MILPPSATRARSLPQRRALKPQPSRKSNVSVNALFGGKAPAAPQGGSDVEDLRNTAKRFGGPSESANQAIAKAARSLGRVNTNLRSNDLYGKWEILYASGNTGLTALEGKISTFTITRDNQYENECTSRVAGVFPGYAKEGGTLKAMGGSKFELLQEYREYKRGPGGVLVEEVEDAPVRGFEVLALTPDTLMLKLATTSYTDEQSGRRVNVQPDGDYFLVWSKAGAATARTPAVVEDDEEEVRAVPGKIVMQQEAPAKSGGGGLFGGFSFGSSKPSFATIAERGQMAADEGEEEDPRVRRQREAAEARMRKEAEAEERKRSQQEAAQERKRAQQDATAERKRAQQERQRAQQSDDEDMTEVVKRPVFGLGSIFGGKKAEEEEETVVSKPAARGGLFGRKPAAEEEDESDSETAVVSRPFAGLFGGKKEEPEEPEPPKRGGLFGGPKRAAPAPTAARGGTQRGGTQRGGAQRGGMTAEERKKAREEAAEQKRQEAEERKRAAAEARAQAKAEADQRKQEEQQAKEEAAAMRQRIQEVLSEMQSDVKQAGAEVKELTAALRTAEKEGRDTIKAGEAAAKQLDGAESTFNKAEAELDEANSIFNEIAGQLRDKQREVDAADAELKKLENDLVKV